MREGVRVRSREGTGSRCNLRRSAFETGCKTGLQTASTLSFARGAPLSQSSDRGAAAISRPTKYINTWGR